MWDIIFNIPGQPVMYHIALFALMLLVGESALRLNQLRWAIAGVVYLTVGLWYFVDPPYRHEAYREYRDELPLAFLQVLAFLIAFRLSVSLLAKKTKTQVLRAFDPRELDRGPFVKSLVWFWLILFSIGMYRAEFQFVDTLFPLGSRWSGAQMWSRGRIGGGIDFLVSIGYYCYMMSCAVIGIVAVATRVRATRVKMLFLAGLTWPMFLLSGTRSSFLTVCVPAILAVLILKRWTRARQLVFVVGCFSVINVLMLVVIAVRNQGVGAYFDESVNDEASLVNSKHQGLNMTEELIYIDRFQSRGTMLPSWGGEYFAQAVNFVPRALWPSKPSPGEQFAVLRMGYHNGMLAGTVSQGVIGQGVENFGMWVGPLVPAVLLALMTRFMCELPRSGIPFLRACVVIFLLALVPNLGRDLTLFTLWPAIFAVVGMAVLERYVRMRHRVLRNYR